MKRFDKAKKEYMEIKAEKSLEERVSNVIAENKPKLGLVRKTAIAAASFALVLVGALNIFPNIAYSLQDIPVIGRAVNVITFRTYEHKEAGYKATVAVPKIEGLLDKELEDKLNREFKENADYVIMAFERDVKALKKEFGDDVHVGITSSYMVKTDNENILALDVYVVNEVGSSSTKHSFYNIDKTTGELLTLGKIFGKGDYVTPISKYIREEMQRKNTTDEIYWVDDFHKIDENQDFYINDKGNIVICFDKYEVAPGAYGCPEFEIPKNITESI